MKNVSLILFFALLIFATGCCNQKSFDCNCDTSNLSYNDSLVNTVLADTAYSNRHDSIYNLQPLSEMGWETYRLEMGHSFSFNTQIYTLTKNSSGASLEVRQYNSASGDGIHLDKKYVVDLTKVQWKEIKNQINSSCYWSNKLGKDRCQSCLDGGSWMLQGIDPQKQNCANRAYNIDVCDFGSTGKLGKLCMTIRKYAKEERLEIFKDI